jgi:hypothetical protein
MKKGSEYRQHARECRALAASMQSDDQRGQLLQMAGHWEALARDREALIARHPELAIACEDGDAAQVEPA